MSDPRLPAAQASVLLLAVLASATPISGRAQDVAYRTQRGDTLIGISQRLLERPRDWTRLRSVNRIANPYRMPTGATLRIPASLLRREPVPATVSQVVGEASADGRALKIGERIEQRSELATGDDGYLTIELVDGTRLTLQPRSRLHLEALQRRAAVAAAESRLRLRQGRIDALVPNVHHRGAVQQLKTPGAVISIRGTRYRAAAEDDSIARVEVTEGTVEVAAARSAQRAVTAGFGLVARAEQPLPPPQPLLAAPDLGGLAPLYERVTFELRFAPLAGARGYRVQLAEDADFRLIRGERVVEAPLAKFSGLPDGDYRVRVRGIDRLGLEGQDAGKQISLRARPEPPFPSAPLDGAKLRGDSVTLRWASMVEAHGYLVQLAADGAFERIVHQWADQRGTELGPPGRLEPGEYFWRVASVRADGRRGPFGDVQRFMLHPAPAAPDAPAIDGDKIAFSWPAEPGQRFEFQLAKDELFADVIETRTLTEPRTVLERPGSGSYYMRVRATDADGFVGPYTATQRVVVPARPWWLLLFLIPLAF
jgi:hypothetical protein